MPLVRAAVRDTLFGTVVIDARPRSAWHHRRGGAQDVRWQYTVSGARLRKANVDDAAPVSPS
ncbi:hypothetical protein SAMN04488107_4275 [Geodermatophilus saharensis]|uniref:Uncharacterized protein n=1 Tax=Geodermatophilus saharensis TaxID=1137994 RepID=A0A239ICD3_9ACTN|nr:hypothetical protein SAMN04488107_4275 [Geodermatophilus saharensis]